MASSVLVFRFRFLRFPRSLPAWFPVHSFPVPVLSFSVCFLSPFPDSLPQLFLRCLLPAFAFRIFRSRSAFFRPLPVLFRLLSSTALPFSSLSGFASQRLSGAHRFLSSPLSFPFSPGRFPFPSFRFCLLGFLLVSFRPSLLRSRSCSTGDPLSDLSSGADA